METTQEDTDNMSVHQVAGGRAKEVIVVVDDLIYVFFCYIYVAKVAFQLGSALLVSPIRSRAVIDTNAIVD